MFIRKSTHNRIVEDLHYSYGRKEHYHEQKIQKLQEENENLRIRLNKALDTNEKPRPSRSESITRKIQSYSTPSKQETVDDTNSIVGAMFLASLLPEDTSSSYSSNDSYQPSCSSSYNSSSSYDSSSCDSSSSSFD